MNDAVRGDLPVGMEMTDTGLVARGIVARSLSEHLVLPRPGRSMANCKLDGLGDNTMLGMHLAEIPPQGTKCDHRHLDETMAYIVSGRGFTEIRQDDDAEINQVNWSEGDLVVVPMNAWHRHTNASSDEAVRQLSFRNTGFMYSLLVDDSHRYTPADHLYNNLRARFYDRFADEPGYFARREIADGETVANFVSKVVEEAPGDPDLRLGLGVSVRYIALGGQRTLDVALIDLEVGGMIRPYRPIAEEAFLVLRGGGRSDVFDEEGRWITVRWEAGDLVCPPFGLWRSHHASAEGGVRLLKVRHIGLEQALGVWSGDRALHTGFPTRTS